MLILLLLLYFSGVYTVFGLLCLVVFLTQTYRLIQIPKVVVGIALIAIFWPITIPLGILGFITL